MVVGEITILGNLHISSTSTKIQNHHRLATTRGATSWIAKQTGLWIHLEPWERVGETQLKPQNVGWNVVISLAVETSRFRVREGGELGVEETSRSCFRGVLLIGKSWMLAAKSMGRIWNCHLKLTILLQTTGGLVDSGRKIEIIHNESPSGWNKWLSTSM